MDWYKAFSPQGSGPTPDQPKPNRGGGVDRAINTGGSLVDLVNRAICTVNPNRPNCFQATPEVILQQQRQNNWLIIAVIAFALVVVFLIAKRK